MPDRPPIHMQPLARKNAPSSVERAKGDSAHLRGTLAEELTHSSSGFSEPARQVLKFHGMYQQEDRDRRGAARRGAADRVHNFMVRVKIPAGILTAEQYLALDTLADDVVYNRSIRITTRQNVQLHGILKGDLRSALQRIDQVLLTTLSGCGDVERNIVAPPAPFADTLHQQLRDLARDLTDALTPNTNAYREIWLDGERVDPAQESETLYRRAYLPRKFKTGLALANDDSVFVRDQDLGLIGVVENGTIARYNVLIGGGSGLTHRRADTYARLASPLASIAAGDAVALARGVVELFRDFGDRTDRKYARLKYLVEEWGIDRVREVLQSRLDFDLGPWLDVGPLRARNWLGAHEQGDGRWFVGLPIPSGRIVDDSSTRLKTALRFAVETIRPGVVLTPQQNLILSGLQESDLASLNGIFRSFRVPTAEQITPLRQNALACPSLPTCGLALAEAERVAPEIVDALELTLRDLDIPSEEVDVSITGCPNGCARPYNAEVGLVGRKPGHYDIFVGGGPDCLGRLYAEQIELGDLVPTLRPLLELWLAERQAGERLGRYFVRTFAPTERADILSGDKAGPARSRVDAHRRDAIENDAKDVA